MHCIYPLVSGIRGAENGTVNIFKRGTTVRATIYPDFEGTSSSTPTTALPLDANGGLVVFVNEPVDVQVRDSKAVQTIRFFGAGSAAPDVEVRSPSFNGTDYLTAAVAPGNPNTLKAILDEWITSAGAVDWQVLVGGVATNISAAVGGLGGMFFNVKSPAYGAIGDGTADDSSAIQNAMTAAQAAGGGIVYFPAGTYKVTQTLNVGTKVSLMGVGPGGARLAMAHATRATLSYAGATAVDWQTISGLRLAPSQANSGDTVSITANCKLMVSGCYVGGTNVTGTGVHCTAGGDSSLVVVLGGTFEVGSHLAGHLLFDGGAPILLGARFVFPATFDGVAVTGTKGGMAAFCVFEGGWATASFAFAISLNVTAPSRPSVIVGCDFAAPSSGTLVAYVGHAPFHEAGNRLAAGVTTGVIATAPAAANVEGNVLATRGVRKEYFATDAPVTANAGSVGQTVVRRATNANQSVTAAGPPSVGHIWILTYWNGSGSNIATVTLAGATFYGIATFALTAGLANTYVFEAVDINGNLAWALVGSLLGYTP